MESRNQTDLARFEQLKQSLIASAEQADRGELLDGDEVFDEILCELDDAIAADPCEPSNDRSSSRQS